jgi:hypothetical protein
MPMAMGWPPAAAMTRVATSTTERQMSSADC